jgi:hypothetical protein
LTVARLILDTSRLLVLTHVDQEVGRAGGAERHPIIRLLMIVAMAKRHARAGVVRETPAPIAGLRDVLWSSCEMSR